MLKIDPWKGTSGISVKYTQLRSYELSFNISSVMAWAQEPTFFVFIH